MTTDREDHGFVVSFRHAFVDQGKNCLAVSGVNRAVIESWSIMNNVKLCSGQVLRDVDRRDVIRRSNNENSEALIKHYTETLADHLSQMFQ